MSAWEIVVNIILLLLVSLVVILVVIFVIERIEQLGDAELKVENERLKAELSDVRRENENLKAEMKEKVEALSSSERVKDFYAEAVQEKLNDKLFEKTYSYYDEKMKWQAKEDALHREIIELRSEIRRLKKEPVEKSE